jgi:AraC-like DNA-binding protein
VDPLSDMLRVLQISGAILFRARLAAPWSYAVPCAGELMPLICPDAGRLVQFHVIVEGRCHVLVGDERFEVAAGEVVLFPGGAAHVMCSAVGLRAVPTMSVLPPLRGARLPSLNHRGAGPTTRLLCGFLACDEPIFDLLLGALPPSIVDRGEGDEATWLAAMQRYVVHHGGAVSAPGAAVMQTRLVELMFVEVLRRHIARRPPSEIGWLAGLRDPYVGRALSALHAEPARAWTVGDLARRTGLSRSALAERFRRVSGMAPMHYLTTWRMQVASRLLRRADVSIAEAAARVGYESEAAFHRAFKRRTGESPAAWRQRDRS